MEDCENPPGLMPCRFCGGMCQESERESLALTGGVVLVRINAMCHESYDATRGGEKDDSRTIGFQSPHAAVAEWNSRFGTPSRD